LTALNLIRAARRSRQSTLAAIAPSGARLVGHVRLRARRWGQRCDDACAV